MSGNFFANIQQGASGVAPPATIPVNEELPTITGAARINALLTCDPGVWSGTPTPSISYQWRRNSDNIPGATSSTYTTTSADQDKSITCRVSASNSAGTSNSVTNSIVPLAAPSIVTNPVVSGAPTVGQVLTTTNGVWNGSAPITYAYQWTRNGVNIAGATANTYTLIEADQLQGVACRVTAANAVSSVSATSNTMTIAEVPKIKITYGGSSTSATDATTYSGTINIGGDIGDDRYVFVAVGGRGGAVRSVTSIQINGSAAVIVGNTGACDDPVAIARSVNPVPAGTSVSWSVTFNGKMSRYGACAWGVRTGGGAPVVSDTIIVKDASTDPTGTIDVAKYGGVLAAAYNGEGNAVSTTWVGVTENCDFATESNNNRFSAGNYNTAPAAELDRRITANFTNNNADAMVAISLTP